MGFWQQLWHFLWHEESAASWVVNIVLWFVIIKYLFFPGLGWLLGTSFPVVAVVSSSMEHEPRDFDGWWQRHEDFYLSQNITKFDFQRFQFRNGFNKGDIMLLFGVDTERMERGTVIVYWSGKAYPIIHRYIGDNVIRDERYLMTKGDNNVGMVEAPDLDETRITQERVLGRAILRIPFLGWVKIVAVNLYQCSLFKHSNPYLACLIDGSGSQTF